MAAPIPERVAGLLHLAQFVQDVKRHPARAEPLDREALAIARTLYAGDHPEVANCLGRLALDLHQLHRLPEAEAAARESTGMYRRLFGPRHEETIIRSRILAAVLRDQGERPEAERILREALAASRSLVGDGNPLLKHSLTAADAEEARRYFVRALEVRQRIHPTAHWRIDDARGMVGQAQLRAGRFAEAQMVLLAAYGGLVAHRSPESAATLAVRQHLVELYEAWGRPEQAARFRSRP